MLLTEKKTIQQSLIKKERNSNYSKHSRIAVVHEWLSDYAGSEKVTESILRLFGQASIFSTVDFLDDVTRTKMLGDKKAKTTFIQKLPFAKKYFRYYLPFIPFAVRSHNLDNHDLIISSSHAFAHGVKKSNDQLHICYCHTPMRYIWDMQDLYLEANNMDKGVLLLASKILAKVLRFWDSKVSKNVDFYISNSKFTADRIKRCYGREAKVIYPPINVKKFDLELEKEDFYFTASRLVCYKKTDLLVEAFTKLPDKKLVVIGDGKLKEKILKLATPNITVLSHLEFSEFHYYMKKAKAFLFAGEEDFGITMVEAQACGTPVIGYNKGGSAEIVVDGLTGILFEEQSVDSITEAIHKFESNQDQFDPKIIRKNAERFDKQIFKEEMTAFVEKCLSEKGAK